MAVNPVCPNCEAPLGDPSCCQQCGLFFADGLIHNLRSSDPAVRRKAADNFVFVDPTPETVIALADALNDSDADVRISAGVTLFIAKKATESIVPQLITALDHSDVRVARFAAACLSNLGNAAAAALPRLEQFSENADGLLRTWVNEAIEKIRLSLQRVDDH